MEHTKSREVLWNALGTVNYVAAYYTESQQEAVCKALSEAERYLTEMDDRLSVFKENSEITQINRCAGQCDTSVSEDTFTLLQLAKTYGTMTGGLTALSQGQYPDGTYEGSAEGYRGTVTVKVVVAGGAIESITVESYRDDDQFFERAKNSVISEILARQSTDGVSTVSGATYSSRGIINAVADALGIRASVEAEASDDLPELPRHENSESENGSSQKGRQRRHSSDDAQASDKANDSNANQTAPDTGSSQTQTAGSDFAGLKDGTYSGQGQGRNGSIEVSVKVSGGKVTSITLESSNEDAPYLNRAKDTVIGEIIDSQSLNVQTVSGATMSSNGIIDAVANALGMSFTNPNSSMQRGHHH